MAGRPRHTRSHLAAPPPNRSAYAAPPANGNTARASGGTNQEEGGAGGESKGWQGGSSWRLPQGGRARARGRVSWQLARADGGLASGPELTAAGHAGYTGHAGEQAVFAQGSGGCRRRRDGPA